MCSTHSPPYRTIGSLSSNTLVMNFQALLEEAINGTSRTEDVASQVVDQGTFLGGRFYWTEQQDDLLLNFFYEVKTRATSQLGFKKNVYASAAKLINTAFGTRTCTDTKVKYRIKELKARYKVARSLIEKSSWNWNNGTFMIEADEDVWEAKIATGKEGVAALRNAKLEWFSICDKMWINDIATGSHVLHSTDPMPATTASTPSPQKDDDSPDISTGKKRRRQSDNGESPAPKHLVHQHKFDVEMEPISKIAQALKVVTSAAGLTDAEQYDAIKAIKGKCIDIDFIIGLKGTTHLIKEIRDGIHKNHTGGL